MDRRKFAIFAGLVPLLARSAYIAGAANRKGTTVEKPLVLLPESARVYEVGHGQARILVGAQQSGGAWWLGSFLSESGRKTSLHVHHSADEQFYVVEGTLSLWADSRWQDLPSGAVAVMPRGVPHALGNRSKQSVRFLASGDPAGFERFFPDIEVLVHQFSYGGPEFLAELAKVYKKYDSELLGPPPPG